MIVISNFDSKRAAAIPLPKPVKPPLSPEEKAKQERAKMNQLRQNFINQFNTKAADYEGMAPLPFVEALLQLSNSYLAEYKKSHPPQIEYLLAAQTIVSYIVDGWKNKDEKAEAERITPKPNPPSTSLSQPSVREKYSLQQEIDQLFAKPAEVKFPAYLEAKAFDQPSKRSKLRHWTKGLHLTHQVDQHQQQQHNVAIEEKKNISLDAKVQTQVQVDAATHVLYQDAVSQLKKIKAGTAHWLDVIKEKIFATHGIKAGTSFFVSSEAFQALKTGNDYACNPLLIDLEKLAAGISLVRNKQGGISLIHEKTDDKKKQESDALLMDYAGDIKQSDFDRDQAKADDPIWLAGTSETIKKEYDIDDAKALLKKLGIAEEEQAVLLEDLAFLNNTTDLPPEDEKFREAIAQAKGKLSASKDAKEDVASESEDSKAERHQTLLQCLALIREAHYRFTQSQTEEDAKQENAQPQGQWLRLEQALTILLVLRQDRLFQIDTSEGKTLMLQWIALLKALQGQKGDVLTHNAPLAEESADSLKFLSHLFGLKVAKKTDAPQAIIEADILYCDASTAVINHMMAQFAEEEEEEKGKVSKKLKLAGQRKADFVLIDEVDNILIDILAGTRMQISVASGEADASFEAFLMALNEIVHNTLPEAIDKEEHDFLETQRDFVRDKLSNHSNDMVKQYYQMHCANPDNLQLDFWISAAATAANLEEKVHYVVESEDTTPLDLTSTEEGTPKKREPKKRERVYILHKDTTGRVDKISEWGGGVHQCVAAREKRKHPDLKIPGLSVVIAEGDIAHYIKTHYASRSGFTGILGEAAVQKIMQAILETESTVILPRAKKDAPEIAHWPQVPTPESWPLLAAIEALAEEKRQLLSQPSADAETKVLALDQKAAEIARNLKTEAHHSRRYDLPPIVCDAKNGLTAEQAHAQTLLEAVRFIQAQNLSGMLFFETPAECEEFADFLTLNSIDSNSLQILDDTHPEGTEENKLRPSEATVIARAKTKGQITLATAAGSRGTDFKEIDVGIITKPGLLRVLLQKLGRFGRNLDFGITCEIYCKNDLGKDPFEPFLQEKKEQALDSKDQQAEEEKTKSPQVNSPDNNRFCFFMQAYEKSKQSHDVKSIEAKVALTAFKQQLQTAFVEHRRTVKDKKEHKKLNEAWEQFFGQIDLHWQADAPDKMLGLFEKCFAETTWQEHSAEAVQAALHAASQATAKPTTSSEPPPTVPTLSY